MTQPIPESVIYLVRGLIFGGVIMLVFFLVLYLRPLPWAATREEIEQNLWENNLAFYISAILFGAGFSIGMYFMEIN